MAPISPQLYVSSLKSTMLEEFIPWALANTTIGQTGIESWLLPLTSTSRCPTSSCPFCSHWYYLLDDPTEAEEQGTGAQSLLASLQRAEQGRGGC